MKPGVHRRFDVLRSPVFIVSLATLALNDLVLKAAFHNWMTGKLSDFSGLAAFSLFCLSLWPRHSVSISLGVASGFVWWKSSWSQSAIDLANGYLPFAIGRVVDYSDLLALPIVWIVLRCAPGFRLWGMKDTWVRVLACTSLVVFTGTTTYHERRFTETGRIPVEGAAKSAVEMEAEVQGLFDKIAGKHQLACNVCEPLSQGRLYSMSYTLDSGYPPPLALVASIDVETATVIYEVLSGAWNGPPPNPQAVDAIYSDLREEFMRHYPSLKLVKADKYGNRWSTKIRVSRRAIFSIDEAEDQNDFDHAFKLFKEIVERNGLRKKSETYYFAGRLLGPSTQHRELTVSIWMGGSPLIVVDVQCQTPESGARARDLAHELGVALRGAFGKGRVSGP